MHTCENCGHLLPVHYLYALCQDCRLLLNEPDEPGAYDDIDITHDETNNEHEHD